MTDMNFHDIVKAHEEAVATLDDMCDMTADYKPFIEPGLLREDALIELVREKGKLLAECIPYIKVYANTMYRSDGKLTKSQALLDRLEGK